MNKLLPKLDKNLVKKIESLVDHYIANQELFKIAINSLLGYVNYSEKLNPYIHSYKHRLKDPDHLRDKLLRKAKSTLESGEEFDITPDNLFTKINDLAGFRIIHLHTRQIQDINSHLRKILLEQQWAIIEGPTAKTWDDESREYFASVGIGTSKNPNMYTSVHYIVQPSPRITCEIQVRTLMEEVWGEVDHTINYPHKTESLSCREQIKALARATSSCSRLVDSIFATFKEHIENGSVSEKQPTIRVIKKNKSYRKSTTANPKKNKLSKKSARKR